MATQRRVGFVVFALVFALLVLPSFAFDLAPSKFATAPISAVEVTQNKEVVLTYYPTKLDSKAETTKTFKDLAEVKQFVDIRKQPYVGNLDFQVLRCATYTDKIYNVYQECAKWGIQTFPNLTTQPLCEEWKEINATELKTAYACRPIQDTLTLKDGEDFKIVPDYSTLKLVNGQAKVWEDLFIDGQKVEGATWWNVSFTNSTAFSINATGRFASLNVAGNLENYTFVFVTNTASRIASGTMNPDCSDLRPVFNGSILPYYIANGTCNTATTVVRVKALNQYINKTTNFTFDMFFKNTTPVVDGQGTAYDSNFVFVNDINSTLDRSGTGNNLVSQGAPAGASLIAGVFGGLVPVGGWSSSNYSTGVSATLNFAGANTLCGWQKTYAPTSSNQMIMQKGFTSHSAPYYQYGLKYEGSTPAEYTQLNIAGTVEELSGAFKMTNDTWYYICSAYTSGSWQNYINGVQNGTSATAGAPTGYNTPLVLGRFANIVAGTVGALDHIAISNVKRSASWIASEYSQNWLEGISSPLGAPIVTLNTPSDNAILNAMQGLANFSAVTSGANNGTIWFNSSGWVSYANQTPANITGAFWVNLTLPSGIYKWSAGACSPFGCNYDFATNRTVSINNFAPTLVSNSTNPTTPYYNASGQVQLCANATDDLAISSYVLRFNETNYSATTLLGTSYCKNFTGLSAGVHNFTWFVNDTGNVFTQSPLYNYSVFGSSAFYLRDYGTTNLINSFGIEFTNGSTTTLLSTTTGEILTTSDLPLGNVTGRTYAYGFNSTYFNFTNTLYSVYNTTVAVNQTAVYIIVYDEASPTTSLGFNVTFTNTSTSLLVANQNPYYNWFYLAPTGEVTLTIVNGSYPQRNYFVNITPYSSLNVTAYLLSSGQYVRFHTLVSGSDTAIVGARVSAYRFIGSSMQLVEQEQSDSTGTTLFYLSPFANYNITATASGCSSYSTFPLQPTATDYYIRLVCGSGTTNATFTYNSSDTYVVFQPDYFGTQATSYLMNCTVTSLSSRITTMQFDLWYNNSRIFTNTSISGSGYGGIVTGNLNATGRAGLITATCTYVDTRYSGSQSYNHTYWLLNGTMIYNQTLTLQGIIDAAKCTDYASTFTCGAIGIFTTAVVGGLAGVVNPLLGLGVGITWYGGMVYAGFFAFQGVALASTTFAVIVLLGIMMVARKGGLI